MSRKFFFKFNKRTLIFSVLIFLFTVFLFPKMVRADSCYDPEQHCCSESCQVGQKAGCEKYGDRWWCFNCGAGLGCYKECKPGFCSRCKGPKRICCPCHPSCESINAYVDPNPVLPDSPIVFIFTSNKDYTWVNLNTSGGVGNCNLTNAQCGCNPKDNKSCWWRWICTSTNPGSYTATFTNAENCSKSVSYSVSHPSPTVDIKANGLDGPITIPYNTSAALSWNSINVNSCQASGDWSGLKPLSGSELTGNLTSSKIYNLTCSGPGGSVSDSVIVNVSPNNPPQAFTGPDKEVLETQSVILEGSGSDPDGDPIDFLWFCDGGSLSDHNVARPIFYAPNVVEDTSFTCVLTVSDSHDAFDIDSMNVLVKAQTLFVGLEATPNSGTAPLDDVDLKATVTGTATGTINYKFDCQNDGIWDYVFDNIWDNPKTVIDACDYPTGGIYNAKVYVERGAAAPTWAVATINVSSETTVVDIKANGSDGPVTIDYSTSATLSWTSRNADFCEASGDWSGVKSVSGSESTGNLTSSKIYYLTCYGPGRSGTDSVIVDVSPNHSPIANAGPDKIVFEENSVILEGSGSDPDGDPITYFWSCEGGSLSDSDIAQPEFYAPLVSEDTTYNCTLTIRDPFGLSDSDSMEVLVKEREHSTLFIHLEANPDLGYEPLNNVDLKAIVSGTASGKMTFRFDCTNDGDWERSFTSYSEVETAENLCDYSSAGVYTAKVKVYREGLSTTDTDEIEVLEREEKVEIKIDKEVRNLTKGQTSWFETISAKPSQKIGFKIWISSTGSAITRDIIVKDDLPEKFAWWGNLKVDGEDFEGDITDRIEIGDLEPGKSKKITFEALLDSKEEFPYGTTNLINTVLVYNADTSKTDTAKIVVRKTAGRGSITGVSTGVLDSAKISLFVTIILVSGISYFLLLKSYLRQKMEGFRPEAAISDAKERIKDFLLGIHLTPAQRSKKRLSALISEIRKKEEME